MDAIYRLVDRLFLPEFKLKGGEVTAIKICYPPIGSDIFAAGMHVAAMMPCGHISVYTEGDKIPCSTRSS